jgi:hypothetical protein
MPAVSFGLPIKLVARDPKERETIRDYILSDQGMQDAADVLSLAIFMTNPLDCLFQVYRALGLIDRAVAANVAAHGKKKGDEMMSFDDTFILFLAVYLGSDVRNIFPLADFVGQFAPRKISSIFQWAKTMLEAVAIHARKLDLAAMRQAVIQ